MIFSLAGKSCVVTGASRGLGKAIVLAFAEQGADVVLAARSVPDLEAVARDVQALGRRAVVRPTDVTSAAEVGALADTAVSSLGKIDVWVNNAGGFRKIGGDEGGIRPSRLPAISPARLPHLCARARGLQHNLCGAR